MDAKVHRWVQRRGWDRAVRHYQTYWQDQLRPAHERVLAAADLQPAQQVIDIACGTGMVTLPAATAVGLRRLEVVAREGLAVDRREPEVGARRAEREVAVLGQGHDLPGSAPRGRGQYVLSRRQRPAREAGSFTASLGAGTVFATMTLSRLRLGQLFPIVDARVSSDVCPMFFALGAGDCLAHVVECAGFIAVDLVRLSVELVYADAAAALGTAFLGGPVALAYSRFDDATKASAHDEYLTSIALYRAGDGYRVPGEFVIASGRRP